jgi:predicted dehydrogenase/threonine dehydrogenase-like Zn-dependent dehydrogenase
VKHVVQAGKERGVILEDVAAPVVAPGHLLIRTTRSLISAGTERAVVETGASGYVARARQQPERVTKALDKLKTDGLGPTVDLVRGQTKRTFALGYSSVGRVVAVGPQVSGWTVGDRVASNGPHAELNLVPVNLCAHVPDDVTDDEAAFTVLGSIALQGVRLANPTLGETVAVIGLGLVGQLAAQLLRASGAHVLGFDTAEDRAEMARRPGVDTFVVREGTDPVSIARRATDEVGVDAVIVTASSSSDDIVHQAADMCRKRGRVVVVGSVGLGLRRADMYEKELTLQVSCSYGPGRYDTSYEDHGVDYPLPFVRWTEQRNFTAVLGAIATGALDIKPLISDRWPLDQAEDAYASLLGKQAVGILLDYPEPEATDTTDAAELLLAAARVVEHRAPTGVGGVHAAVIGTGGFAQARLLPALQEAAVALGWVASSGGSSAATAAHRFGASKSTTDPDAVLADPLVNLVVVATRHDSHASLTSSALRAGKSVYVEKPLCTTTEGLHDVMDAYDEAHASGAGPILAVGFNRRFAPHTVEMRRRLAGHTRPIAVTITCNAGRTAPDHWVNDPIAGGGRLIGEACHFIDLVAHLVGAPIVSVHALAAANATSSPTPDTATIQLELADGSVGTVLYLSNGSSRFPKERVEVFTDGTVLLNDNFRTFRAYGRGRPKKHRLRRQDKGNDASVQSFIEAVRTGGTSPIPFEEIIVSSAATLAAAASIEQGRTVAVGEILRRD